MGTRGKAKTPSGRMVYSRKRRDPLPWERQIREPLSSFEAFVIYRDMPERSTHKVAEILDKNTHTLETMCTRNRWHERVVAWDNEVDRRIRAAELNEAQKMVRRQIQLSLGLQEAATLELQALVKRIKFVDANATRDGRIRQPITNVSDIIRLVEAGTKLERLSRDMPNELNENRLAGPDGEVVPVLTEVVFVKSDKANKGKS